MEWFVWMVVALAVASACRGGCARGRRGGASVESGRARSSRGELQPPRASRRSRPATRSDRAGASGEALPAAESPLDALQRRFVEGRIDVDQYERELDRLYALEGAER